MLLDRLGPRALVGVALFAGLAFQLLLGTSYIGAFLDPVEESTGIPVAIVDLDTGARGAAFVDRLTAADTPVRWVSVAAESEAVARMESKEFRGTIIIPANFTTALESFATPAPHAATLVTYENPGATTTGSLVAKRVVDAVIHRLRVTVQEEALQDFVPGASGAGILTLDQARFVADPVKVDARTANAIPSNGANGLAPAYLAAAAWMGGYVGAVALERFRDRTRLGPGRRLGVVAVASIVQGVLATAAVMAVGFEMRDPVAVAALVALGTFAAYGIVNLAIDLMGVVGIVPAFAVMAIGLPGSGAIYPMEMLPAAYRALSVANPFTWMAEAFRTVLYTPAAHDAMPNGMRLAVLGALTGIAGIAWVRIRRVRHRPSA